ncbi:uncharacterized protein N0V89_008105 [Didymosphaeria variabile]|uniref:Uncharacterized protein n=1 Tax=Didymosphaeria variabile TaxID=1932322 RepID=A0A9W9C896_9PLEO|nr:uncharacterized protein N0V89_008105 [Didymosphaeria variabile]KAJ4349489.1 hypothetical protein N0V89_008105 [Didymosphaeria variabile]
MPKSPPVTMLNALKLSELLNKNTHPSLYPRLFVMSPNGTLMAYTTPIDIRDLRDQAALISMAWKDHVSKLAESSPDARPELETLTIETANNNIIARAIQPSLLLVLVGGVPPSRKDVFKITPEAKGEARYPPLDAGDDGAEPVIGSGKAASVLSTMSSREKDVKGGALHIQRKKIDALTDYLRADFEKKGFVMPDDAGFS